MIETIARLATILAALVGSVGAFFAVRAYSQSVRLKRAEWLQKLYQQFYEHDRYRTVRQVLDYRPTREISEIHSHLDDESRGDLVDQLWDYLNFFEFVAGLLELKQIEREDLMLLFDYPLRRIAGDERIMARLGPEGYEHLIGLLRDGSLGDASA